MPVNARLYDARGRPLHSIERDGDVLPVVATTPAQMHAFEQRLFTEVDDDTTELAIDSAVGGGTSDEKVWNGDETLWSKTGTLTDITDTQSAHSGTYGLNITGSTINEYVRFDAGSALALTDITALSFWVQGQSKLGIINIQLEDASGALTGNVLNIQSYITWSIFTWQQVVIPVADFGAAADIRYLRMTSMKNNQLWWMDDISLASSAGSTGSIKTFRVAAEDYAVCFEVHTLRLVLTAPSAGWAYDSFATIAGGLPAGLLLRYFNVRSGETFAVYNMVDNRDLLGRVTKVDSTVLDSEAIFTLDLDMSKTQWLRVVGTNVLDVVVRDDLSSLISLKAWAIGGEHRGYFEGVQLPGAIRNESEPF